ncbi:MAG: ferredoxin [Bacillota bacterium]|jgi:uncharacterized ferredoxin-like protein|nr:ferredoxin [Bacillota bacterium]
MIYNSTEAEKKAAHNVAELMMAAARTAPKGCGVDNLVAVMIDGEEKAQLADQMRKIAEETGADFFARDGGNVDASPVIVILGVKNIPLGLENCGYCGFKDCAATAKAGASCAFNVTDLGIAVGSAVSVAANHRFDNRVMFSAGKAAMALKFLPENVRVAYGIPLSASGKSIFFDRATAICSE